jgi:tetratricopeptide (TPR) repeat protein
MKETDPPGDIQRRLRSARFARALKLAGTLAVGLSSGLQAQYVDVDAWKEAGTRHFIVLSNADSGRAGEIARTLEAFRAAFGSLAPEIELRSPVPTRILAFRDEESFSRFKSGAEATNGRILGQFLTHPDGNFMTVNADPRLLGGVGVVLHEYVHYLVSHNFPGVPRWFNEGLAEYYSTFAIEGDRAVIGRPVERHVAWMRQHGDINVAEVLDTDGGDRHHETEAGHFYAVSWGLVHYLISNESNLGARLADLLTDSSGRSASSRFEEVFGLRIEELEKRLTKYLVSDGPRAGSLPLSGLKGSLEVVVREAPPSSVLNDLGSLLLRIGDETAANRFFNVALEYDPGNGDAYASLGYSRHLAGRFEEADVLFAEAMERAPRDPRSFLLFGRHLLGRLEDARRAGDSEAVAAAAGTAVGAFESAIDLMPDFAEAWALLGSTYLYGGFESARGVVCLERAIDLLPGRIDLYFQLLQLELRAGDIEEARRLAAGPIERPGGEEWVMRAEEEIDRTMLLREADEALREGRLEEGRDLLEQAIQITSNPDLRYRLELNLERLEEYREQR